MLVVCVKLNGPLVNFHMFQQEVILHRLSTIKIQDSLIIFVVYLSSLLAQTFSINAKLLSNIFKNLHIIHFLLNFSGTFCGFFRYFKCSEMFLKMFITIEVMLQFIC